jgi:hypothetical protein
MWLGSDIDHEVAMCHERIESSPNIMDGKPVIRGTASASGADFA